MTKVVLCDGCEGSPTRREVNEFFVGEHRPILLQFPPPVYHGFKCVSEIEAMISNCPTEGYVYDAPDEYRIHPHENEILYEWIHVADQCEAILNKAEASGPLRVVTDQVGSPTLTTDLADAVARLLDAEASVTGHFTNWGHCSWFQYAEEIAKQAGLDVDVEPITLDQLDRPARRPAYSVLDTAKHVALPGSRPARWQDALERQLHARKVGRRQVSV